MKKVDWNYIKEMANDVSEDDEKQYSSNEIAIALLWIKDKLEGRETL